MFFCGIEYYTISLVHVALRFGEWKEQQNEVLGPLEVALSLANHLQDGVHIINPEKGTQCQY